MVTNPDDNLKNALRLSGLGESTLSRFSPLSSKFSQLNDNGEPANGRSPGNRGGEGRANAVCRILKSHFNFTLSKIYATILVVKLCLKPNRGTCGN